MPVVILFRRKKKKKQGNALCLKLQKWNHKHFKFAILLCFKLGVLLTDHISHVCLILRLPVLLHFNEHGF